MLIVSIGKHEDRAISLKKLVIQHKWGFARSLLACSEQNIPVLNNYCFDQFLFCIINCSDQGDFSIQITRAEQKSVIVLKSRNF